MNDKKSEEQTIHAKSDRHGSNGNVDVREPSNPLPKLEMADLSPLQQAACKAAGWTTLTPVQSLAIPYVESGREITVQSRTGSGKTGSYLLPLLTLLDPSLKAPQALILVPTRELALQVEREADTLFGGSGLKACAIYGGVGYNEQLKALKEGAQVIIGTPGRVLDLLLKHHLDFQHLKELVFDEADRMLSIGFYQDIINIASHLPSKRHTTLFSATYPPNVMRLAREFMEKPEMLSLSHKEVAVPDVEHLFCKVKPLEKDRALVRLLETENPSSAIIFCNTKADAHYVAEVLKGFGYKAEEISSDLPQKKREAVLAKTRKGEIRYLVATDVAARGIDIPELSHVFLYAPPDDQEIYIHRAGRTGRAGAAGTVITLVDPMQKLNLDRIANRYKVKMREISVPTDEEVARVVGARLETILKNRLRNMTGLEKSRAERYLPLAAELLNASGEDEEQRREIIAMLLDDYHRQLLKETRFPRTALEDFRPAVKGRSRGGAPRRKPQAGRRKQTAGASSGKNQRDA